LRRSTDFVIKKSFLLIYKYLLSKLYICVYQSILIFTKNDLNI
jgi:hypothetical protein